MNKILCFARDIILPITDYILSVGVTVLVLSVIPIFIIVLVGILGIISAAMITVMLMLNTPINGFLLGILFFIIVIFLTVISIALLISVLILVITLTALPISLIIQKELRQKEIKSWFVHLVAYIFSGGLTGLIFGTAITLATWANLKELQYSVLATISIIVFSVLFGVLSVNICGITLSTTRKFQNFFLDHFSNKVQNLMSPQEIH